MGRKSYKYLRCLSFPKEDGMVPLSPFLSRDLYKKESEMWQGSVVKRDKSVQWLNVFQFADFFWDKALKIVAAQQPKKRTQYKGDIHENMNRNWGSQIVNLPRLNLQRGEVL